jgi:protein TonB
MYKIPATSLVALALLAGCSTTTSFRGHQQFITASCRPAVIEALPAASKSSSIWRQPGASGNVAARAEEVRVDVAQPQHQAYFSTIRERIRSKWVYPRPAGERGIEGELLIEFHIAKDGRLEYIELRHSSGTQILDEAALTAVKLAQPFPPVPDSLCKETLGFRGVFRYEITRGG